MSRIYMPQHLNGGAVNLGDVGAQTGAVRPARSSIGQAAPVEL